MCNLYRSVKGSLHHDLLVSEVKNIWIFNRRFDVHEKLFSEQKANGIKVNKTFRDREETTTWIPHSSFLGPLLFNIILNGIFLFFLNSSFSNHAGDSTLYTFGENLKNIENRLRSSFDITRHWIYEKCMALNRRKYNFISLESNTEN